MNSKAHTQLPASVTAQVANLPSMRTNELKALWRKLYKEEPYTNKRGLLERRLAYRLQEVEYEKNNKALIQQNKARIQTLIDNEILAKKTANNSCQIPRAGAVLTRMYQGKEHQVTITHDEKFTHEGQLYDNLSAIARKITGTRWSGPVFFNLRKTTRNKPSRR